MANFIIRYLVAQQARRKADRAIYLRHMWTAGTMTTKEREEFEALNARPKLSVVRQKR